MILQIFCSEISLQRLRNSREVLMDGTFEIAPKIAKQLYSLHGFFFEECFPLGYALLQDKSEDTYRRLFRRLKEAAAEPHLTFAPAVILIDFEVAVMNAVTAEFPSCNVKGCLFHFSQCTWRKVTEIQCINVFSYRCRYNTVIIECITAP